MMVADNWTGGSRDRTLWFGRFPLQIFLSNYLQRKQFTVTLIIAVNSEQRHKRNSRISRIDVIVCVWVYRTTRTPMLLKSRSF
jgi:hypothetical protein